MKINFVRAIFLGVLFLAGTPSVQADLDTDRAYSFYSVGYLKAWDNVDGLFGEYVDNAYREYFKQQGRFQWIDLSHANDLLTRSRLPYHKLVEDKDVLGQVARSAHADCLVRTKIFKEGPTYRFVMDWLHGSKMDVIASHQFVIEEERDSSQLRIGELDKVLIDGLNDLIKGLPFMGQVTGRDQEWVTVNLGNAEGLKAGDSLVVQTLSEVKRHPLLGSIVEWKFSDVGRLRVEEVDQGIAYARIESEVEGSRIERFQKITKLISAPQEKKPEKGGVLAMNETQMPEEPFSPKFGWASARAWTGGFNRTYSGSGESFDGGGFLFGVKINGEIWITQNIFSTVDFGFGFSGYSQANQSGTLKSSGSLSMTAIKFAAGYQYYFKDDLLGPKAYAKLGYQRTGYSLPVVETELLGSVTFSSIYLGLGATIPIYKGWGTEVGTDLGMIRFVSESGYQSGGGSSGVTDVSFYLGGYYRFSNRLTLKAGLDVVLNTADFKGGDFQLNQNMISFAPSMTYFF